MEKMLLDYRILVFFVYNFIQQTQSVFLPSIQWTPQNPMIKNLNGKVRNVQSDDGLHIWCPKDYTQLTETKGQIQPKNLYFTLYKVATKEEYEKCDATKGKQLLKCDNPEKVGDVDYKLILFQENPIWDIFDPYIPGNTYYFIGTSGGRSEQLHNKIGGKCATDNFKFAIYVCRKNERNCNVEVRDGGWSLWRKNPSTGLCERNCTNPAPQNGGYDCKGPSRISCSKVIIGETRKEEVEVVQPIITTETPMVTEDIEITSSSGTEPTSQPPTTSTRRNTTIHEVLQTTTTEPPRIKSTIAEMPSEQERGMGKEVKDEDDGRVILSMKEAVLTFIGLFIVGCMVGIVQVLAILHLRNKRLHTKQQAEPANAVNV